VLISDKVAIVTGAGSGIGQACSLAFASHGARVLVADVDESAGRETVAAIADIGGTAEFVATDVTRLDDLAGAFDAAENRFGGLDILCNNAGIVCGEPLWPATDPERLSRQVDINLRAVILGTRLAIDHLAARGGGAVANVASLGALLPLVDEPGYSATKAGVVMFTRACAPLHQSHNVRVNAVLPGLVDTPLLAKSGDGTTEARWASQARQFFPLLSADEVACAVIEIVEDDTLAGHYRIVGDLPEFVAGML
jgi:NAD(P)-dependent dehydrogenase (short-subunit alcohol dehydrogenase family)